MKNLLMGALLGAVGALALDKWIETQHRQALAWAEILGTTPVPEQMRGAERVVRPAERAFIDFGESLMGLRKSADETTEQYLRRLQDVIERPMRTGLSHARR